MNNEALIERLMEHPLHAEVVVECLNNRNVGTISKIECDLEDIPNTTGPIEVIKLKVR